MTYDKLIYDWNKVNKDEEPIPKKIELCDETLRDGLQSPSVHDPCLKDKLALIELMAKLHISIADIGLPGAGERAYLDALHLAQHVKKEKLNIKLICAARTLIKDIEPIARIQEKTGIKIASYCFLGTSPIRQMVEDWNLDYLLSNAEKAINFAIKEGLEVGFVTEDTTRSDKETLRALFNLAINCGCSRLVLCDTVGHVTFSGVRALVNFCKELIKDHGSNTKIDWHGHNDRGLGLSNALFAALYGCDRIHGTALGMGERVGNTAIDQLILNLKLMGAYPYDVSELVNYVKMASKICKVAIPNNYPLSGSDAFRTATGVHAAAVIKAKKTGNVFLADAIYSGVLVHLFGKEQQIDIGPMSGASNVKYWLEKNKYFASESQIDSLLKYAKGKTYVLSDQEIKDFLNTNVLS